MVVFDGYECEVVVVFFEFGYDVVLNCCFGILVV